MKKPLTEWTDCDLADEYDDCEEAIQRSPCICVDEIAMQVAIEQEWNRRRKQPPTGREAKE
jgi:hypothetical protein